VTNASIENSLFYFYDEDAFKEVMPGFKRRIIEGEHMSLCFWRIADGSGPTPYGGHLENEQFGFIIKGTLDFRLNSEERHQFGPGDIYYAPLNVPHGDSHFIGDEETGEVWILDIFQPIRAEYTGG
jgi:mannose-6-phosphate isomerase-like protein (cupin superfamily)